MPLPSVQGYLLGTRQPLDYVGLALDAFSQVSGELRATRAQNLAEQRDARDAGQSVKRGIQGDRLFEEQLTDIGIDREDRLIDRSLRLEDQEMQRQEFLMRMEEAQFERDTLRPLQIEGQRLLNQGRQLDALEQRRAIQGERLRLEQFNRGIESVSAIGNPETPLPQQFSSVQRFNRVVSGAEVDTETGETLGGPPEPGTVRAPLGRFPLGSLIAMEGHSRPFIVTGDSGDPEKIHLPEGVSLTGDESGPRFALQGRLTAQEIPATPEAREAFLGSRPFTDSFEALERRDRLRAQMAGLRDLEEAFGGKGSSAIDTRLQSIERAMEADPEIRALRVTGGTLTSPEAFQKRAELSNTLNLRLFGVGFKTQTERDQFFQANPGLLDQLAGVPDNQLSNAINAVVEGAKPDETRFRAVSDSLGFQSDLRSARKAAIETRAKLDAARNDAVQKIDLPRLEAENRAAEQFLRELEQEAGLRPSGGGAGGSEGNALDFFE